MFPIEEFNERFGTEIPEEDFHTVAGFVFGQLGRAPEPGDDVVYDGLRFDVLEVEGNRIERVCVTFSQRPEPRREGVGFVDEDELDRLPAEGTLKQEAGMIRTRRLVAAAVALGVVLGAGTTVAAAGVHKKKPKRTTLVATVADPLTISLTKGGRKVAKLKAGTYVIVVRDQASDHDFHLTGPGVDKVTSVSGKGTVRWQVKLVKGTYDYVCDPHASFMKGSFTVS